MIYFFNLILLTGIFLAVWVLCQNRNTLHTRDSRQQINRDFLVTKMDKPPPPRRRKSSTIRRDDTKSTVEILQLMGFPKHRAEKAIAATGDKGVNLASDWLLSHVNDPDIDSPTPRQYVLYLCPIGPLQEQMMTFYNESLKICGWNGSHSYFPHITLCPFFSVENSKTNVVKEVMKNLAPYLINNPGPLKLDFFSQTNFIGLFVKDDYYRYLSELVNIFAKDCKAYGIDVEPAKKQLHVTLAYQYGGDMHDKLTRLAKQIDLNAECLWELRAYSRDPRLGKSEVRKVKQAYKASLDDELDLIMGDYVFMDTNETSRSSDKWYNGTSWLTGQQGMFPGPFTERTAETWTWALHESCLLGPSEEMEAAGPVTNGVCPPPLPQPHNSQEVYDALWKALDHRSHDHKTPNHTTAGDIYAKVNKPPKNKEQAPRQLYVVRHAERMDFLFGRSYCDLVFDDDGNYTPVDLNMPRQIPKRASNQWDYAKDAPLTCMGKFQAYITGEALKSSGVVFHHVYSSPSFRCIQTATEILRSMGQQNLVIRVEPGIFEWLGWYQLGLPKFFTPSELKGHGFNIDVSYMPITPISKFDMEEDIQDYYKRSGETSKKILSKHQAEGGNVLMVGHAGSVEVCIRQLIGKTPRSTQDFREICPKVPYCGLVMCQEDVKTKKWSVQDSPILPFTHGQNKKCNVRELLYPS